MIYKDQDWLCKEVKKGAQGEKLGKIPKDVSELLKKASQKSAMHDRTGTQDTRNPLPRPHHSTTERVISIFLTM